MAMNVLTDQKVVGRIVQNGEFCFEFGDNYIGSGTQGACLADGYISQLASRSGFLIEDMDYAFRADARVAYQGGEPFIEILCLDSINALHCERNNDAAAIRSGVHIYFHRAEQGELRFFAGTPIRGLRIVIKDKFFNERPIRGFSWEPADFSVYGQTKDTLLQNPKLRVIFSQIRGSIHSGMERELYYESKIAELLCVFAETTNSGADKPCLPDADMAAVEKARAILDERFSDAPTIARIAFITGTSQTKLQNDFKTAFGCTIHDYLQAVRMARALDLIEHTEAPLYIIAKEVGCKNPGRFAEIFKNAYGMTPDIYRRNLYG
jgi:AraC-like DNA-binding protein